MTNTNFNITQQDIDDGKIMAGIAYFWFIGLVIAFVTSSKNRYVLYHCQQAIAVFILSIGLSLTTILKFLPYFDWFFTVISFSGQILVFVLFLIGLSNGFSGKVKPIPLIGEFAYNLNLMRIADNFSKNHNSQNTTEENNSQSSTNTNQQYQTDDSRFDDQKRLSQNPKDPYDYGDVFKK